MNIVVKEMTRKELLRVIDEFKSERDAAKQAAMRAFDERNILLNQLATARRDALLEASHKCRQWSSKRGNQAEWAALRLAEILAEMASQPPQVDDRPDPEAGR